MTSDILASEISASPDRRGRLRSPRSTLGPRRDRHEPIGENPWTRGDVVRLTWFSVLGLIGVGVCYIGAAQEAAWTDQRKWVVGAIASILLAGMGPVGWLITLVHRVRAEAQNSVRGIRRAGLIHGAGSEEIAGAPEETAHFATDSMTMTHLSDCPLLRGKSARRMSAAEIDARRLSRCGVCQP